MRHSKYKSVASPKQKYGIWAGADIDLRRHAGEWCPLARNTRKSNSDLSTTLQSHGEAIVGSHIGCNLVPHCAQTAISAATSARPT
jgi:hypothetical protein